MHVRMVPIQPVGMRNPAFAFQDSSVKLFLARYRNIIVEAVRFSRVVHAILESDINIVAVTFASVDRRPGIVWSNNSPVEVMEIGRILAPGSVRHGPMIIRRTRLKPVL